MTLNFIFTMVRSMTARRREANPRHRRIEGVEVIVCHCKAVTDRAIRKAVRNGARTRNDVASTCATDMSCGGCAPVIDEIIEAEAERENRPASA
jgi:bacterioferritin-associated ferredoxin